MIERVKFPQTHIIAKSTSTMQRKESLDPEGVRVITSLRSDSTLLHCKQNHAFSSNAPIPSQFYMLSYHRDRLLAAARDFHWPAASKVLEDNEGMVKLERVLRDALDVEYYDSHCPQPLKVSPAVAEPGFSSIQTDGAPDPYRFRPKR